MLLLREMVIITLFIVGYNITTGCIPGTYTKFYIYRIAFIFYLVAFTITWFLSDSLLSILAMIYYWTWILLYFVDYLGKRRAQNIVLMGLYKGQFIYDYANYALGPDNANAEKVAIEDGGIFRFNWIAPITDQSYLIFCYQQSEDMFVCIAWSLFFGIKTFKDVVITIISILDRIVWIPCIVTIDNYAWYFYTAFCVIYFYLRKFLPAAKVVGVIVDSCLTLIAVACLATAIFLMIGGDISVLQRLWQTIFRW